MAQEWTFAKGVGVVGACFMVLAVLAGPIGCTLLRAKAEMQVVSEATTLRGVLTSPSSEPRPIIVVLLEEQAGRKPATSSFVHHGSGRLRIVDAVGYTIYNSSLEWNLDLQSRGGVPERWKAIIGLYGARSRVDVRVQTLDAMYACFPGRRPGAGNANVCSTNMRGIEYDAPTQNMPMLNIKYYQYVGCVVLLIEALTRCSSKPILTVEPDSWIYEGKAISISVRATADLNAVSERSHALAISIFQLSDTNTFTGLSTTRDGAIELLDKGKIDSTVAQHTRVVIQPGEKKLITLDRAQTAKYVGIIAGYHQLDPSLDVRVFQIPAIPSKRGLVATSRHGTPAFTTASLTEGGRT